MVLPRSTAKCILLKWFVNRVVPTCAPSSNGTIIPIHIPSFLLLVYLHSKKFICSTNRAKSGVLVKASCHILLSNIIRRHSSRIRARNALYHFIPIFHFLLLLARDRSWSMSGRGEGNAKYFGLTGINHEMTRWGAPYPCKRKGRRFWACSFSPLVAQCLCKGSKLLPYQRADSW